MKESDEANKAMLSLEKVCNEWSAKKRYYVENRERHNGDSMVWWKKGGHGYSCNLEEAEVFNEDDPELLSIIAEQKMGIRKYRIWDKAYIDSRVWRQVSLENIDCNKEFVNEPTRKAVEKD